MFLSGLKCLGRLERQVKFAKNRCCKIKPVAVNCNNCCGVFKFANLAVDFFPRTNIHMKMYSSGPN